MRNLYPQNKNKKEKFKMFSQLIVALATIGYVIIKKSNIELSIDGRLVVLDDFYDSLYNTIEQFGFEVTPITTELEGDSFKIVNNENEFILNVIYC